MQQFRTVYEIVQHEGVHAGTGSYHNIFGRTRSHGTRSVGTIKCSSTDILRVLFPYAIEIVHHEGVRASASSVLT